MFRKVSVASLVAIASVLSACGGGGGGDSSSGSGSGTGGSTPATATVAGPLDPVQTAVTTSVISPLVQATAGTPLQGVLLCANSVVTRNALDIADAFANGLQNPATLAATTPAEAQASVTALVSNLSNLLTSLAGGAGCTGNGGSTTMVPGTNPLAGTPLAALGDQLLPALMSAQQQLSGASSGSPLSATQLSTIVAMLSSAFNTGVGQLPTQVTTAPILGGTILTVQGALNQLTTIATAGAAGGSPTVIAADLQALAQSIVSDLLTKVLPVASLQGAAGSGASSDPVAMLQAAVATLTASLGTSPTTTLPSNPLSGVGFSSLSTLITQLQTTLTGGLTGGAGAGGSPLTLANGLVQTLLGSLLAPITGGTGGTGGSSCPLHFLGLC